MARKTYKAEQIIGMLREAEVRLSQGEKTGAVVRIRGSFLLPTSLAGDE